MTPQREIGELPYNPVNKPPHPETVDRVSTILNSAARQLKPIQSTELDNVRERVLLEICSELTPETHSFLHELTKWSIEHINKTSRR